MNPINAASAVTVSSSIGMQSAGLAIMAVVIVLMGLALIKMKFPNSKAATVETNVVAWFDGKYHSFTSIAEAEAAKVAAEAKKVEPTIKTTFSKVETGVDNELSSLLASAEKRLLDTSGEDASIAAAQAYLAKIAQEVQDKIDAANAAKAAKAAALTAHVAALTAPAAPAVIS